ncbi:MAG: hemolysin family protein [Micrococcales bacterium]|nr:hemolysin family protein [Micrococcales bacterium]MCL2667080.1 hemolysin family protein [Micrococcales bacterium]
MVTQWLLVLLGVVLTAGTAVFVAAEFAMVALDPAALEVDERDRRGRSVLAGLRHLSTQLSGAQVGITLTTILLGYTTQPAVARLARAGLEGWLGTAAAAVSAVAALVLVNAFSMVVGELVPKNLAIAAPMATARVVVPVQRGFTLALRPVIVVTNGAANALLRMVGVEPREELTGSRSPAELAALVRRSAERGTLEQSTATLLTNSLDFAHLTAVDVMTDRTRLHVVRAGASAADVLDKARTTGHSRFPVIEESRDDIVGLVHLRRVVQVPYQRRSQVPAAALMAEAPQVPETVRLGPLLEELRHGLQMVVVVDEYGGTSGVVTLEDVVEELVGEVADEHDRSRSSGGPANSLARRPDGSWVLPGVLRPDELAELTGLVVPEDGPYETLGGLVMARLGSIPQACDQVVVDGVELTVAQMDGRRVELLRVAAVPDDNEDGSQVPAQAPCQEPCQELRRELARHTDPDADRQGEP